MQLFFGPFWNIYYIKDLANVLYETCALAQEKTFVKLVNNIKNNNTSHENPYFGQCDGGTWRQFKLDKPFFLFFKLSWFWTIYIETRNIQWQKHIKRYLKANFHIFTTGIGPLPFLPESPLCAVSDALCVVEEKPWTASGLARNIIQEISLTLEQCTQRTRLFINILNININK